MSKAIIFLLKINFKKRLSELIFVKQTIIHDTFKYSINHVK